MNIAGTKNLCFWLFRIQAHTHVNTWPLPHAVCTFKLKKSSLEYCYSYKTDALFWMPKMPRNVALELPNSNRSNSKHFLELISSESEPILLLALEYSKSVCTMDGYLLIRCVIANRHEVKSCRFTRGSFSRLCNNQHPALNNFYEKNSMPDNAY